MQNIAAVLPRPKAILVVSAHWETRVASVSAATAPAMIYDYSGFPPASYHYQYPAPGKRALADKVVELLRAQGITAQLDSVRGFDHGTFVPLMLMYPQADIPVVQLSSLYASSIWVPLTPLTFRKMAGKPGAVFGFYLQSFGVALDSVATELMNTLRP